MSSPAAFQLPKSVYQYLTDPNVRAGVDSVLDYGSKKLPPGLEWNELPQYFRAVLAASSVQVDWALAHEHLWRSIWPSSVQGWSPASLDEQSTRDFDAYLSVEKCWTDEWLWRCFTKSPSAPAKRRRANSPDILYLGVSISLNGASIGVSIEPSTAAAGPDPTLFRFDDDAEAWRSVEQSIISQTLDLSALQQAARQALMWATQSANSEM